MGSKATAAVEMIEAASAIMPTNKSNRLKSRLQSGAIVRRILLVQKKS